jgi:hypothetical protein
MAPEIVLGQKMPDKHTDRFSMSVILFMMFVALHPLEGVYSTPPCMTEEHERLFYGKSPLFVFDPKDTRNRPNPALGQHATMVWNALPDYVQAAFITSFSKPCMTYDPNQDCYGKPRILERDWLAIIARFRNSIFTCSCGNEMIVNRLPAWCSVCSKEIPIHNRLRLKKHDLFLFPGVRILRCQVEDCQDRDALQPVLTVHPQPGSSCTCCIVNDSHAPWQCVTTKGQSVNLPPQEKMPVLPGIKGTILTTPFEIV